VCSSDLARKFHMPFVDLDDVQLNPQAVTEIDRKILNKYGALPLDTNDTTLVVAISDPLKAETYGVLRFTISKSIVEVMAIPSQIKSYLDKVAPPDPSKPISKAAAKSVIKPISKPLGKPLPKPAEERPEPELPAVLSAAEPATEEQDNIIARLADKIILDARAIGASDIHIEPNGSSKNTVIRFRVGKECELYRELLPQYARTLITRYKIMAQLDRAEQGKPQDGKILLHRRKGAIELRLTTVPTVQGHEDAVLQFVSPAEALSLDEIGLEVGNRRTLLEIIHKPHGLILCVGPPDTGKTTTLHAILHALNRIHTKIWTVEDPVEITQERLRQVQVNREAGMGFAEALRTLKRADADVILIGEIRDRETAALAVEASLCGRRVLSALQTLAPIDTILRLLNLGLDSFALSDALLGIVSQRLVRKLCEKCKESYKPSFAEATEIVQIYGEAELKERYGFQIPQDINLFRAKGCEACRTTGYQGRVALHEILINNDELRDGIERSAKFTELKLIVARSGMRTLCQDGLDKALAGKTDLVQVFATCPK
jgi:type II secretory ATPase GspE/PulE/Tfp pilus assembly ATPase PilB-like protein